MGLLDRLKGWLAHDPRRPALAAAPGPAPDAPTAEAVASARAELEAAGLVGTPRQARAAMATTAGQAHTLRGAGARTWAAGVDLERAATAQKRISGDRSSDQAVWQSTFGPAKGVGNSRKLRSWADTEPIIRMALNRRRDQIAGAKYDIVAVDPDKPYSKPLQAKAVHLFAHPNSADDSYRAMTVMFVEDLLALDRGVLEKERNAKGEVIALWNVDAAKVAFNPKWDGKPSTPRYFYYESQSSEGVPVRNDEMIVAQINQRTYDLNGLSPIQVLTKTIEALTVSNDFQVEMAKQHPPSGLVFIPNTSGTQVEQVSEKYQAEAAGRKALFFMGYSTEDGGDGKPLYFPMVYNAQQMEWQHWQEFMIRTVAGVFGMSPFQLGLERDVNRSTAETQQSQDEDVGLFPLMELIQGYYNREVLPGYKGWEQANLQFMFLALNNRDARADAELTTELNGGMPSISMNEARRQNGHDPVPTWHGNAIWVKTADGAVPLMMVDGSEIPAEALPQPDDAPGSGDGADDDTDDGEGGDPAADKRLRRLRLLRDAEEAQPDADALQQEAQAQIAAWLAAAGVAFVERALAYLAAQSWRMTPKQRIAHAAAYAARRLEEEERARWLRGQGLTGVLAALHSNVTARTISGELAKLGHAGIRSLDDPAIRREISARAQTTALGVLRTYTRDALALADGLPDDTTEDDGMAALEAGLLGREPWRARQVARTEAGYARHAALRAFVYRNALEGEARCLPETYADARCGELVEAGWVPLGAALLWELPVHPNCVHTLSTRYFEGQQVRWTGGTPEDVAAAS